jgi:hypothetical protein
LTHCVRLGATVTRVTRADKDGGVAVRGFHGGTSFHDRFDYLVMGAPLMGCGVYMDLDDQEQQLFGAMQVQADTMQQNRRDCEQPSPPYPSQSFQVFPLVSTSRVWAPPTTFDFPPLRRGLLSFCWLRFDGAGEHSEVLVDQVPASRPVLVVGLQPGRGIGSGWLCVCGSRLGHGVPPPTACCCGPLWTCPHCLVRGGGGGGQPAPGADGVHGPGPHRTPTHH